MCGEKGQLSVFACCNEVIEQYTYLYTSFSRFEKMVGEKIAYSIVFIDVVLHIQACRGMIDQKDPGGKGICRA